MLDFLKRIWSVIQAFFRFIGLIMTFVLLSLLYVVLVVPLGLLLRMIRQAPLYRSAAGGHWQVREPITDIAAAAEQPY